MKNLKTLTASQLMDLMDDCLDSRDVCRMVGDWNLVKMWEERLTSIKEELATK